MNAVCLSDKIEPKFHIPAGALSPLMWAAAQGNLNMVQNLLLAVNIDINEKGPDGWTALVFAAAMGHLKICQYLLQHGARLIAADKEACSALGTALSAIWPTRRFKSVV